MHQARDENGSDSRSLDDIREFEPVELDVEPSDRPPRADGVVVWTAEEARSRSTRADNDANARGHEKVDILFLAANPRGADMLALEKEAGDIFRKTERVRRLERKLSMSTRIDDLAHDLLRHRPTVVHFAGHGSRGGKLLLEDEHGAAALVSVAALGRLFRDVGGVRCVVLNACFSAEHASAVAQHVPCVVAMSAAIADTAAIAFASAFYEALAFGRGVEQAFRLSCDGVALRALPHAEVPRLLFREGVNPAEVRVFDDHADAPADPPELPAPHPLRAVIAAVGLILFIMAIVAALRAAA